MFPPPPSPTRTPASPAPTSRHTNSYSGRGHPSHSQPATCLYLLSARAYQHFRSSLKSAACAKFAYRCSVIEVCSMSCSQTLLPSNVGVGAHSILAIIARDDASALKQSCTQCFLLPSTEASRASLAPILACAVTTGAVQCAGAALLHGADPNLKLAEQAGATLLHVAASRRDEATVSNSYL